METWVTYIGFGVAGLTAFLFLTFRVTEHLFTVQSELRKVELETRKRELGLIESVVEPQTVLVEAKTSKPKTEVRDFENYQPEAYSWRDNDSRD
jgi:hypothetical protein